MKPISSITGLAGVDHRQYALTLRGEPATVHHSRGLRVIAAVEAAKGAVVLLAGFGVLLLIHRDVQAMADRIVAHLHLNPASRYPRIFLRAATETTPGRLRLLALGAFVYSSLRFVEAAGLWHERRWAEWFAVATGLIYVPFEAVAFTRRPEVEPLLALVLNLVIVLFMGIQLRRRTGDQKRTMASATGHPIRHRPGADP